MTSFYDLDYIIELNEKRLEQYTSAYQRYLERFTVLLVIYSAFAIFLIPITESLYFSGLSCHWLYHVSFYVFLFFFGYSLFYTVKLLIPTDIRHLAEPQEYYAAHRQKHERDGRDKSEVDSSAKAAYIYELQEAVTMNRLNLIRKTIFYRRAFTLGGLAITPYLVCIWFYVGAKKDNVQKIEIVNKFSNFTKTP
jgi:hypothetical protein